MKNYTESFCINSVGCSGKNAGKNVFSTDVDDSKIDYKPSYFNSAFSQNPFENKPQQRLMLNTISIQ